MKGKQVYIINLMPYSNAKVFANYDEAENYLKEFAQKNGFIFDEDCQHYVDRKNRVYYVSTTTIL